MGPPISRATTQHGRWGCHHLSCVHAHASPRFREQRPSMGGGAATALRPHPRKPPISRNDPARAVGLPPPVLRPPCPRKPLDLTSNDPGPSMGSGAATACLVSTSQAPDFAQRPSTGGGAATACPASSLSTQGPPISRAMTQDPAAPLPVLRPHPRKPPISRNDPARAVGLPPPVLHPHCPRKAPRSRDQRPRTSQPHYPSCVHTHASPRFRATTPHGRWSCHRLSCILTLHARPPDLASNDPA